MREKEKRSGLESDICTREIGGCDIQLLWYLYLFESVDVS